MAKYALLVFMLCIVLLLQACGSSEEDISESVKESMQETLNNDPNFSNYNMDVAEVDVIHLNKNSYKGIAIINYNGQDHRVSIDVVAKSNN